MTGFDYAVEERSARGGLTFWTVANDVNKGISICEFRALVLSRSQSNIYLYDKSQKVACIATAKTDVCSDRMLGEGTYLMLTSKPAHPNVGKAFIDFFLDDESMKILAQQGEFVTRKGIHPPISGADKIKFVEMNHLDEFGFAEKKKEYEKLFLQ